MKINYFFLLYFSDVKVDSRAVSQLVRLSLVIHVQILTSIWKLIISVYRLHKQRPRQIGQTLLGWSRPSQVSSVLRLFEIQRLPV